MGLVVAVVMEVIDEGSSSGLHGVARADERSRVDK
jgi:hypothetical protein